MPLIGLAIWSLLVLPPLWRILPRYGFSPMLSLVAVIPIGLIVLLWILAFQAPRE